MPPPLAAPPTVLPSAGGSSPSAPPAPLGAAGGSNPSAPPVPLGAGGGGSPAAPPEPLAAGILSSSMCGMEVGGTLSPDATGELVFAGTRNGYPYYTTGGIDWAAFLASDGGQDLVGISVAGGKWEIWFYDGTEVNTFRGWYQGGVGTSPPSPDLVAGWSPDYGTGDPVITPIAGASSPPAPLGAGGGGGSPGSPPAVVPHAGGVLPGVTLAGALNPDVTGTYIYAGTLNDRGVWSQDGALTPPALGSWARVAYDGTRWQIRVWSDGVLQTSRWAAASGAETLPSSADWTLSAMGTYTGTPVVTTGGALPPPPVVLP